MLISLNWIRDFVDLPRDIDPRGLAERFTVTVAEVEGVEHVTCDAAGLVAGEVLSIEPVAGHDGLFAVRVSAGAAIHDSVTIASGLKVGDKIVFAPPGARAGSLGTIAERETAGRASSGMILPGDVLGLATIGQRAVWLTPSTTPGTAIEAALFDDWIIEVDNKSITHRPDLWGHYGIAREIAAMHKLPLRPYEVTPVAELAREDLPAIPIVIDDPEKCPRYSGLRFTGVSPQPAPLWMQVRLAHVGLRPIDILVDLTNYIMAELGQPMHAFDGANVDRIEVADAAPGEKFTTLDGVERSLPAGALMIQCNRRSVALAGVMGGTDTEVTAKTTDLLLESANFEPATIRRTATALGHRTDASARFEKSLDPANTVLAIQRFVHLAKPELPGMTLTSRLSDAFPKPPAQVTVQVDPGTVAGYVGRTVEVSEIRGILEPLEFTVREAAGGGLEIDVPRFRATKDISIEADIIEEIARCIGYDSIAPAQPVATVRYLAPDDMGRLERQTLRLLCRGLSYAEVHRYIWFDDNLLKTIGYDPGATIALRNPVTPWSAQLRTSLIPGMLSAIELDRHHLERFELLEIGSVFPPCGDKADPRAASVSGERRHLGLALVAPGRKSSHEDDLMIRLKTDLQTWAMQVWDGHLTFDVADDRRADGTSIFGTSASPPWQHDQKTADILLDGERIGRLTVVPAACKRAIDEHLAAWSIALAEVDLTALAGRAVEPKKLAPPPTHPRVELDFSVMTSAARRYKEIEADLATFDHPLLHRPLWFQGSYEGGSVSAGQRSFTFRATIAAPDRTLTENDVQDFRSRFLDHLQRHALALRG